MKLLARTLGIAALIAATFAPACATRNIPNTDVEDTELHRDVLAFCEEYRRAVERRNIALLMRMAHPSYYEDGGNVDPADDLDYEGLRQYLENEFRDAKAIRYEIRYRRVGQGRNDIVFVDFTYSASYKLKTPSGEVWRREVADNRLELVREEEGYKIISGM
jgi:hypothetical protein